MKKILTLCLIFTIVMSCYVTSVNAAAPTIDKKPGNISAEADEFKITFAENVTKEMLDTISFKKKSGEILVDIKGGAFVAVDSANPKIAVVKHGVLDNKADYVLTVGEDTYDYTAGGIDFSEDFKNYSVGDKLSSRPASITAPVIYFPSTDAGTTSDTLTHNPGTSADSHYIAVTSDGDKYLSHDPKKAGANKSGRIVLEFPEVVTDDLCVDMKVRVNGSHAPRHILLAFLKENAKVYTADGIIAGNIDSEKIIAPTQNRLGNSSTYKTSGKTISTLGSDGFYDLRIILERKADGSYKSTLRNLNAPSEGDLTVEGTNTGLTGIYGFWLTQFYSTADPKEGTSVDLSEINITSRYAADVLHIDDVEKTDKEMAIVFTNDVSSETLSALTMKDATGKGIPLTFSGYDEAARKAYYKFGQILTADAEYTLLLEGIKDADGIDVKHTAVTFKTEPEKYILGTASIVDGDGNAIDEIGSAEMLTYSNTVSAEVGKTFTLALAIFDSEGRFAEIISDTKTVATGQTSVTLQAVTPPEINLSDGYTIKTFVWEDETDVGNVFVAVTDVIE